MKSTPVIEKSFKSNLENYEKGKYKKGEKLYQVLMEEIKAPNYFDRNSSKSKKYDFSSNKKIKLLFKFIKNDLIGKNRLFQVLKKNF